MHAARHGWDVEKDAPLFRNWAIHTGMNPTSSPEAGTVAFSFVGFMLFKNQGITDKLNCRLFKVYFVFWLRIFKFYSLGKFHLYDRLLALVSFYFYCMCEMPWLMVS